MRIFLTGLQGSGKTYLGKIWAEDNCLDFYDLDTMIEHEERMSIEKIFSNFGEGYFREKEAAILRNTDRFENCIIACGGGTPCFFDNMEWMNRNGLTVFLNESEDAIFHHLVNDKVVRPLMPASAVEMQEFIKNKSGERMQFYRLSKMILSPENLNRNGFNEVLKNNTNA